MTTASELVIELGGREEVAACVRVKPDAVRMAEYKGQLPTAWFDALETKAGRALPREAFAFRAAAE